MHSERAFIMRASNCQSWGNRIIAVLATSLLVSVGVLIADDPAADVAGKAAKKADKSTADNAQRPRLPNHFADVVDAQQRETILRVYERYAPKIKALREQLAALQNERNQEIRSVLTAEQQAQVDARIAAARAKRKSAAATANSNASKPGEESASSDTAR
jgi:hypothetical protein